MYVKYLRKSLVVPNRNLSDVLRILRDILSIHTHENRTSLSGVESTVRVSPDTMGVKNLVNPVVYLHTSPSSLKTSTSDFSTPKRRPIVPDIFPVPERMNKNSGR